MFRYPGIRSDSDMYTFGYSFRPWLSNAAIADGAAIRSYIRETAEAYGIDRKIRFRHRVTSASWSSADALWTIEAERGEEREPVRFTCNFLFGCTGYYDYANGYTPEFAGAEKFAGRIVHPQHWPESLDYSGKRVVVIGSGATAVTIIPVIAETAAHVTMLQRSPTYIVARPTNDQLAKCAAPVSADADRVCLRALVLRAVRALFLQSVPPQSEGGEEMDRRARCARSSARTTTSHTFHPRYNPWDQRLCLAPDADFFRAIKSGKADIVTDTIENFTEKGIRLQSGRELAADIIITATGLKLQSARRHQHRRRRQAGDVLRHDEFQGRHVQRRPEPVRGVRLHQRILDAEMRSDLRLCGAADQLYGPARLRRVHAAPADPSVKPEPLIDFSSGYIQRAIDQFPRQGSKKPWRLYQNYVRDLLSLRFGAVDDPALEFERRREAAKAA